jgi:membrane-bound lytic murein transglycosylase A
MLNLFPRSWSTLSIASAIVAGCASPPSPHTPQKTTNAQCNCPTVPPPTHTGTPPKTVVPLLEKSSFSQLPNWDKANHTAFLAAFSEQCDTLNKRKNTPQGLLEACKKVESGAGQPARLVLETHFDAWQLQQEDGKKEGLLTGYYEPLLKGSRKKQSTYTVPLYGVPKDLITVKLDAQFPELKGKRLRGRLQGNTLVPYFDRAQWEQEIGPQSGEVLVWVDNKLDAFLLQVQGSGRVTLPNGQVIRLSYADQNGHPYKAIAKVLIDRGELKSGEANIPAIRAWAEKNPWALDELLNANPSVVFFQENTVLKPEQGPTGGLGVPLKGGLSLAVDRSRVPYGSMLWVDSTHPITQKPLQHGMLAQDTGGAIRGRVRGDYFWGTGYQAGQAAGTTKQNLSMWLIWPKESPLPNNGSDDSQ